MNQGLFQTLADRWDAGLTNAVATAIAAGINAVGGQFLTGLLTIYVIVFGFMWAFKQLSFEEFFRRAIRAGIIVLLINVHYNDWIAQPLLHDIPNWIAASIGGSLGSANGAGMFDDLARSVVRQQGFVLQQASGLIDIAERLAAYAISWCCTAVIGIEFFMWEIARAMIALVVALGPWLIPAYLFDWSRNMALHLAGQAIAFLLVMLMLAVIMTITVNMDRFFTEQIILGQGSAGLAMALNALANTFIALLFGLAMTVVAPVIAFYVAGGAASTIAPFASGAVGAAIGASAAAGRAARRAGRAAGAYIR